MTLEEIHAQTVAAGWTLRAQLVGGQVYAWLRETTITQRTAREFVAHGATLADALAAVVRTKNEAAK